jgi:hypothetical protein
MSALDRFLLKKSQEQELNKSRNIFRLARTPDVGQRE